MGRLEIKGMEPICERKQLPHPAFPVLLHVLLNDLLRAGSDDEQNKQDQATDAEHLICKFFYKLKSKINC